MLVQEPELVLCQEPDVVLDSEPERGLRVGAAYLTTSFSV